MRVAWAFTGAGHFLKESVMIYEKVAKKHDVTVLMSKAGEEVLKMYGLYDRVKNLQEVIIKNWYVKRSRI